jgi:NADP-dependent 3-hydroxy acid dehydrogenase YdfG
VYGDVPQRGDLETAIRAGVDVRGVIDILVNNAGVAPKVDIPTAIRRRSPTMSRKAT